MGVWIEIDREAFDKSREDVTPFMGVWIEICLGQNQAQKVTPFMGVWIEISPGKMRCKSLFRHSLYGSVD